ncbi:MAG: 50S ribosomal protein L10 [Polyangiales bacterium]
MDRETKQTQIGEIKARFDKMTSMVLLDYKGMNVETVSKLRSEFRKAGVEYKVVKNTLVKQALKGTKLGDTLSKSLSGMTGLAWSYEDPSAAAKVVKAFKKDNEKLSIRGAVIDGQLLDGKQVESQLATMPGKDELRSMLLATFQAPMQQLVALLNAPAQNFAYLLAAKEREAQETAST